MRDPGVALRRPAAAAVALLLDELLGEPPVRLHPVVAMGGYLRRVEPHVPAAPAGRAVVAGGLAWAGGAVACAAVAAVPARGLRRRDPVCGRSRASRQPRRLRAVPWSVAVLGEGLLLWPLLSGRLLRREVAAVEAALGRCLPDGRAQVSRLVSRDTGRLDDEQVRAAALGSLSENLCDSVVAPLLAHAAAGLPGAALYRYVNTADAVWGYRTPRWQHAGRVAARADDVANLLASRLTGLLLLVVPAARRAPSSGLGRLLRELPGQARLTPSPNGGWPMGALSLLLDVRMPKPGVYELNAAGHPATPADTALALRLAKQVTAAAWTLLAVLSVSRRRPPRPDATARCGGLVDATARCSVQVPTRGHVAPGGVPGRRP